MEPETIITIYFFPIQCLQIQAHLQTPTACLLHLQTPTPCLVHLHADTHCLPSVLLIPTACLLHLQIPTVASCTSRYLQLPPAPPDTYSCLLHLQTPMHCLPAPPDSHCLPPELPDIPGVRIRSVLPDHWIYPEFRIFEQV